MANERGSQAMMDEEMERRASELCIACGLCCNGILYDTAPVQESEIETLEKVGFPVMPDGSGRHMFMQPCAAHRDGRCQIYEARPSVCRQYKCRLLVEMEAGRMEYDVVLRQVQKALKLYGKLRGELKISGTRSMWNAVRELQAAAPEGPEGAALRRQHAGLILDAVALARMTGTFFTDEEALYGRAGFEDSGPGGEMPAQKANP